MQNHQNPASADVCTVFTAAKTQRPPRAKRLQTIRTELPQKAEKLGLVPPGATLLPAAPTYSRHRHYDCNGFAVVESSDSLGNEIALQKPHIPDKPNERHGRWYGSECRVDSSGIKWSRFHPNFVVDNFGDLVPVPA